MNEGKYKVKISRFEHYTNYILIFHAFIVFVLGLSLSLTSYKFNTQNLTRYPWLYDDFDETLGQAAFFTFFQYFVMFNQYICLDLLVAFEISRFCYSPYMENDVEMMHGYKYQLVDGKYKVVDKQGLIN